MPISPCTRDTYRHPFPVPLRVYDETLRVMKEAVGRAKLGSDDKLSALRQLDLQARALERSASEPDFDAIVRAERARSPQYGRRSVAGIEPTAPSRA